MNKFIYVALVSGVIGTALGFIFAVSATNLMAQEANVQVSPSDLGLNLSVPVISHVPFSAVESASGTSTPASIQSDYQDLTLHYLYDIDNRLRIISGQP